MKKLKFLFHLLFFVSFTVSHSQEEVLFTVDDDKVTSQEFLRVYKKNLDLVKDDSQKDVDNYLELFVNYKLKLKEAYDLKLHEKPAYQRELKNYRAQLVKSYLTDHKVTDALVKEAYERVTNEVKASHILIRLQEHETDTADAFKQITELRERLVNEDFSSLQKELHNGSTIFVEDLGYFSGFKMVYDFETVAYNTLVGQVSQPFRTKFGYHVLKVFEKRPSRGEVRVAHIMVAKKTKDDGESFEKRINDIYKKLQSGESFESLAKQFSDDRSSASKGGELAKFKSGQLSSVVFEDMAFSTPEGEISKPFETQYGWHIIKSIEKIENPSFDDMRSDLELKVKRDSRSKLINTSLVTKLKKQYNVVNDKPDLSYFISALDSSFYKRNWKLPTDIPQKSILTVGDKEFTYQDFLNHLSRAQKRYKANETFTNLVNRLYDDFLNESVRSYHEDNLENVDDEFAQVVGEYRDGLLLFDLMENKIWNAAKNDTIALQDFYNRNKSKYTWEERIDAVVASSSDKKVLSQIKKQLEDGERIDVIEESVSTDESLNVIFTKDAMTRDHQLLPNNFEFKKGISNIYENNESYHLVVVDAVLPKTTKTLDEARGFVVTDFQDEIETNWLKELREKYTVKVNETALMTIKGSLKK